MKTNLIIPVLRQLADLNLFPISTQKRFKCEQTQTTKRSHQKRNKPQAFRQSMKQALTKQHNDLWNVLENQMKPSVDGWWRGQGTNRFFHKPAEMDAKKEVPAMKSGKVIPERAGTERLARLLKRNTEEPMGRLAYTDEYVKISDVIGERKAKPGLEVKSDSSRNILLRTMLEKHLPRKETQPKVYPQEGFDGSQNPKFQRVQPKLERSVGDKGVVTEPKAKES